MSDEQPDPSQTNKHRSRSGSKPMHRRQRSSFVTPLRIATVIAVLLVGTGALFANKLVSSKARTAPTKPTTTTQTRPSSPSTTQPTALALANEVPKHRLSPGPLYSAAIKAQNKLPGTSAWRITGPQSGTSIMGYASATSVVMGKSFQLFVSDNSPTFVVQAYRMGYYQGLYGHLVWTSPTITGVVQPACPPSQTSHTVSCNWQPSLQITTNSSWFPGDYILKLVSNTGQESYVPITVIDLHSNSAVLLINAVTTWQAYNLWGGWDLYFGPYQGARSTIVSFDRPYSYAFGQGAADFIGNELPMVALTEEMGLNVSYLTSIDINEYPQLLKNHSEIVSLGHDEYWSPKMRAAITSARNIGVNLAFLGANAIFRRIRFASSPLGRDRLEINYRIASLDPEYGKNNALVTTNWPSPPDPQPEGDLIGVQYQCNPVRYPMIITDPTAWVFHGTGLTMGSEIPNLVGSEFDGYGSNYSPPASLQLLANSPVLCRNVPYFADMSYYTASSGAGVFATGTNLWVAANGTQCPPPLSGCPISPVVTITKNVLIAFGTGPAGPTHPAHPNAAEVAAHPPYGPLIPTTPTTTAPVSTTTTSSTTSTTTTAPVSTTTTSAPAG